METHTPVKGYKVFNPDWMCSPNGHKMRYEVGKVYEEDLTPKVCTRGFHFCERAVDCFKYYDFNPNNKVAEVLALGEVNTDGTKSCTNKILIVREIPWAELLELVNSGKGCTGFQNSGSHNSGNCNSGSHNSGDFNSGSHNSGDCNSGNCNSGNCNSGNFNSGNFNSGDYNSGYQNSGNFNSGDYNSGNYNSGDWNKCSFSNGCFNTVAQKIYLFNRPSEWSYTDWVESDARRLLRKMPGKRLVYVGLDVMTEAEKTERPEAKVTGGYLREKDMRSARSDWWRSLSEEEKAIIMAIPNFDREIFLEITGIDVGENP